MSASRRQFNIYSRVEGYSFSSQTCLLFQRFLLLILFDSLSSLQSILNLKYDHPVLIQILELYTEMTREGREIVFIWVPGHVGIMGNSAADSSAKDALDGDISVELIPFSYLKPHTNKYILELWQSEWDEFPENKSFKIFPVLKECISCPWKNRKEETVMARLHIGHSLMMSWCLMSSDVSWHIRDKLWPMPKHGSINLYVHENPKAR